MIIEIRWIFGLVRIRIRGGSLKEDNVYVLNKLEMALFSFFKKKLQNWKEWRILFGKKANTRMYSIEKRWSIVSYTDQYD